VGDGGRGRGPFRGGLTNDDPGGGRVLSSDGGSLVGKGPVVHAVCGAQGG